MFNIYDELNRINSAHALAHGYPCPPSITPLPAKSEGAPLAKPLDNQNEDQASAAGELGFTIPASILKPVHGDCVVCGKPTEEEVEGDWCHEGCNAQAVADQAEDHRLDDPRHGQGDR